MSDLEKMIATRERVKYKDYAKHISWVFHKTQVLPKIILMGKNSETVPIRNYKLRICELTRLDASETAPDKKTLFDDHIQRNLFSDVTLANASYDPKLSKKYLGNMNVVIIDDYDIVNDDQALYDAILDSERFLTNHGRILFNIPIWISTTDDFEDEDFPLDVGEALPSLLLTIRTVNEFLAKNDVRLAIEDIKLTVAENAERVIDVRVYLKKEILTPHE